VALKLPIITDYILFALKLPIYNSKTRGAPIMLWPIIGRPIIGAK